MEPSEPGLVLLHDAVMTDVSLVPRRLDWHAVGLFMTLAHFRGICARSCVSPRLGLAWLGSARLGSTWLILTLHVAFVSFVETAPPALLSALVSAQRQPSSHLLLALQCTACLSAASLCKA